MTKKEKWNEIYKEELTRLVTTRPDLYAWPASEIPAVLGRMTKAFEVGSFNKDGEAIKATCRRLKIKHTYRDIESWARSNEEALT